MGISSLRLCNLYQIGRHYRRGATNTRGCRGGAGRAVTVRRRRRRASRHHARCHVDGTDLVVVAASASDVVEGRRTHRRSLFELMEDLMMAPFVAQTD